MNTRALAAVLVATLAAGAGLHPSAAIAKPSRASNEPSIVTYAPSFERAVDKSTCDDGDGTALCQSAATADHAGAIATNASLSPVRLVAHGGRAEGFGGVGVSHSVTSPLKALKYRFYFEAVSASADVSDPTLNDISARLFVRGFVTHDRCAACVADVSILAADDDPLSPEPETLASDTYRVDVELRNPAGLLPKGATVAIGYLNADVAHYESRDVYTSSGSVTAEGRLVKIEVEPVR